MYVYLSLSSQDKKNTRTKKKKSIQYNLALSRDANPAPSSTGDEIEPQRRPLINSPPPPYLSSRSLSLTRAVVLSLSLAQSSSTLTNPNSKSKVVFHSPASTLTNRRLSSFLRPLLSRIEACLSLSHRFRFERVVTFYFSELVISITMPMWMDGGILIGVARPYILLLETKQSGHIKLLSSLCLPFRNGRKIG
ncbi:uncharacterized protein LOC123905256 [Trifolium pratense]|uniref:uncharacterized protein LOC123905256 n=1 Tax=Trifolium pratense TaxID=57577 RepID=UPI001E6944E0|nr:uncharacterized protein LOC123905256 [Trifolium pratense]